MNNEITDAQILDLVLGGQTLREMTAITFLGCIANKLNGVPTYRADTQELLMAVSHAPSSRFMPDDEKVRLARKILALNISLT